MSPVRYHPAANVPETSNKSGSCEFYDPKASSLRDKYSASGAAAPFAGSFPGNGRRLHRTRVPLGQTRVNADCQTARLSVLPRPSLPETSVSGVPAGPSPGPKRPYIIYTNSIKARFDASTKYPDRNYCPSGRRQTPIGDKWRFDKQLITEEVFRPFPLTARRTGPVGRNAASTPQAPRRQRNPEAARGRFPLRPGEHACNILRNRRFAGRRRVT